MADTRILIVEDDGIIATRLQSILTELGYDVLKPVISGEEALEKTGEWRPDLALMDIYLAGEMNGVETAAQLRARFDIPVVYLTAYADDTLLQQAKISAPYGYLVKPVQSRALWATIEMALHRHELETRLKESERWLDTTLRSIDDAVIATDSAGVVTFMNPAAQALTGWEQQDTYGKAVTDVFRIISEKTRKTALDPVAQVLERNEAVGLADDTLLISKDGREIPIDDNAAPIHGNDGAIIGVVLVFRDVTERRRAEETKRRLMHDLGKRIKELNCLYGISTIIGTPGISLNEILQRAVDLVPPAWQYSEIACARVTLGDQEFTSRNFAASPWKQASDIVVGGERTGAVEVYYLEERPESDNGPFLWEETQLLDIIARQLGKAAERDAATKQLERMARCDALTGLLNRTSFMERLERAIQRAKKRPGYLFAVLYLDLDRFKAINDSLGHAAGDRVLVAVARRLETQVRPGDTVARFGGDEFAILLDGLQDVGEAAHIAACIQQEIALPVDLEGQKVFITTSIGIASNGVVEYERTAAILRDADTAMYRAKRQSRAQPVEPVLTGRELDQDVTREYNVGRMQTALD